MLLVTRCISCVAGLCTSESWHDENRMTMGEGSQSEGGSSPEANRGTSERTNVVELRSPSENLREVTSGVVSPKAMQESLMLALILARAMDLSSSTRPSGSNDSAEGKAGSSEIDDPRSGSGSGTMSVVTFEQQPPSTLFDVPNMTPVEEPPTTGEIGESSRGVGKSGRESVRLVYCWFSPLAHRVAISLRAKGVEYEMIEESTLNKNDSTLYANPLIKRIPILMHKGKVISESRIIMDYIEEAWTEGHSALLPIDPFERWAARYWTDYIDTKISKILLQHVGVNVKEVYDALNDALIVLNKAMTVISHGKLYFMGDRLGFVDIMFAPLIPWFQALKMLDNYDLPDASKCPRLHQWLSALQKHPSVQPSLVDSSPKKLRAFIVRRFRKPQK